MTTSPHPPSWITGIPTPSPFAVDGLSPEEDAAYEAFQEEEAAIHEGRATRLLRCFICYLEQTGQPDYTQRSELSPLRGVMRSHCTWWHADPTEVYVLSCGHTII